MGTTTITEYELWEFGGDNYECNQFLHRCRSNEECENIATKRGLKKGDYFIHKQQLFVTNR